MHSMTTTSWLVGTSFSELKCSSICLTLELKTVHIELTAVEILEGLDIFPQTIDYWPPAPTSSPPFPIIGLNLHPKLIIGWQGSYGLMCGLNEAIENRSSSGLQRIIVRQGKYFQMKLVTFTCDASDKSCFSKKTCFSHWSVCKGRMSGNNYIIIGERLPSCLDNNTTLFAPSATD